MMRTSRGRIVRRCAIYLTLMVVAAWSFTTLVGDRQSALAQQFGYDQYQSQLQALDSVRGNLPVGSIEEIFARMR